MQILVDREALEEIMAIQREILNRLAPDIDELVSLNEAERLTGIEYQKLREMFLNGQLLGKRFGRKIRISKTSLLNCKTRN